MNNSGDGVLNVPLNDSPTPKLSLNTVGAYSGISSLYARLQLLGVTENMEDYEKRKLRVFNLLNLFQFIFGIIIPVTVAITRPKITTLAWVAACMPALVSLLVLVLNARKNHEISILAYFILYPVITSIVYLSGINLGIELFFILYGILAVFFIQDTGQLMFTVTLSMISYFILTVVWRDFQFQLEVDSTLYLANHLIAMVFIFFGLFLVKKENTNYQQSILHHNWVLHEKNTEIEKQKKEIADKADLLNRQATELRELNTLKNKLFSVIAHDLRSPIYALKNVFTNVQKRDLPGTDLKRMVPDIINDLNYTTSLMENLLQWAKCQMQSLHTALEPLDLSRIVDDVLQPVKNHAAIKDIDLVNSFISPVYVLANSDMTRLIIRNLVTNSLKFTPGCGYVTVGAEEMENEVEVYVLDTGIGLSETDIQRINSNHYFSTEGTASEKGTGLGLMLCRDFLAKMNSELIISSEPGAGSRFSFRLKKTATGTGARTANPALS